MTAWSHIEADLHAVYGIDVDRFDDLRGRTWRSLRNRIRGLTNDSRTRSHAWLSTNTSTHRKESPHAP